MINKVLIKIMKEVNEIFFNRDILDSFERKGLEKDAKRVAKYWGNLAKERVEKGSAARGCPWTDSPLIQRNYIHPTISGKPDSNWLIWVKENYFNEPVERALNLGCGDGCLERHGAIINIFKRIDAFDISPGAIRIAKTKAKELGISETVNYEIADVNEIILKKNYYDVVFTAMAIHHIQNLEHILGQVDKSLKKRGYFIVNEYVGPNRFQWTDTQLEIANDLLLLLPERCRVDPITNKIKNAIQRQPLEHMIAIDPSEAVRSREIIPLIEARFEVIKRTDYGGTILNLLISDLIVNFDENKLEDMAILQFLFYFEKLLIRKRILESDFSFIVAKKR